MDRCHNVTPTHVASPIHGTHASYVAVAEPSESGLHETPLLRLVASPVTSLHLRWGRLDPRGRPWWVELAPRLAGSRHMGEVFRYVWEVDVAPALPLQASFHLQPCLGVLQNHIHLVERLIVLVVNFGGHLERKLLQALTNCGSAHMIWWGAFWNHSCWLRNQNMMLLALLLVATLEYSL